MGNGDDDKFVFSLTSLQIGDLKSYLSDLSLFVAHESNKLYILVDNRPWLTDLGARPALLWQLMVTKSRLSPFANTKAQRQRKEEKEATSQSCSRKSKKMENWFSFIDAAKLSQNRSLLPVKKLRNSFLLNSELYKTLSGYVVFEVAWSNVRGINYLNELQTDTSLAIEAKIMQRWEFDSIEQAASCIYSWFSGTHLELLHLKYHLDSTIGDIFYDAEENFSRTISVDDDEKSTSFCLDNSFILYSEAKENGTSVPHTPPATGPYKRRRIIRPTINRSEVELYPEETQSRTEDSLDNTDTCSRDNENVVESKQYRDVLILFWFNDRDLPFKLRQVIMSDLRLLTLLEAGLPSWVIFLQSYPGFCHLYRPWMCPLARALYVLISIVTVLIGFYDLYKNVPVLKATASRLFGPLFDWIETWEMVSRIQYLGTILFLHNLKKGVTWFLTVMHSTRSFFSVFTQPLFEPLIEFLEFLLPMRNLLVEVVESLNSVFCAVIGSSWSVVVDLIEIVLWPLWFIISTIWSIVYSTLYPMFWLICEVLYAPIRLVIALASCLALVYAWILEFVGDVWLSVNSIFQLASASQATVSTYEVSIWRSLWKDLFSQVFRAVRSILNGFIAFFMACNRHRLSIYNHIQDFIQRILGQAQRSQPSVYRNSRSTQGSPRQ